MPNVYTEGDGEKTEALDDAGHNACTVYGGREHKKR